MIHRMRLERESSVRFVIGPSQRYFWPLAIGLVAVLLLVSGGVFYVVEHGFTESRPYRESLARLRESPSAVARLGSPIEPGRFVTGATDSAGVAQKLELSIPVHGPKGGGTLRVSGEEREGTWSYAEMTLSVGEERLDLLAAPRSERVRAPSYGVPASPRGESHPNTAQGATRSPSINDAAG